MPDRRDADNSANWVLQSRIRLAQRRAEKPATKAGQIRALWPDIEAALAVGQSLKSIRQWLEEDAGISLGITSLTSYISRIRRREAANPCGDHLVGNFARGQTVATIASAPACSPLDVSVANESATTQPHDPLAQAMRVLSKPKLDIRKIHNDGDPDGRNLI